MTKRRKMASNDWKQRGCGSWVTGSLNLMLGNAPIEGSVFNYENTFILPPLFF
jgi:hypothetical protein